MRSRDEKLLVNQWYLHECCSCHIRQERVYHDSWSGIQVCGACLLPVLNDITVRPSEGDNIGELLSVHVMNDWEEG